MEYRLARLRLTGPMHIGSDRQGVGREEVLNFAHADTLFSALCHVLAAQQDTRLTIEDLVELMESGQLRFSSLMPYTGGTNYFVFKPGWPDLQPQQDGLNTTIRKQWKTLRFVPVEILVDLCQGKDMTIERIQNAVKASDRLMMSIQDEYRPHHAEDRLTAASMIYHVGYTRFAKDAGLYFLIGQENSIPVDWEYLLQLIQQIGRQGIGGRRTAGAGQFECDELESLPETWQRVLSGTGETWMNLSPVALQDAGEFEDLGAFTLLPRRGWSTNGSGTRALRRKTVYFLEEGSLLKTQLSGDVLDVSPPTFTNHPIYRSGIPMYVPVSTGEENTV